MCPFFGVFGDLGELMCAHLLQQDQLRKLKREVSSPAPDKDSQQKTIQEELLRMKQQARASFSLRLQLRFPSHHPPICPSPVGFAHSH
jgi:hypothetical protein